MLVKFKLQWNANTYFVKADAQIGEHCRRTISYLQGYSCPKLFCKKLSNLKPMANTVRSTRRTTVCWMRGTIKVFLLSKHLQKSPSTSFQHRRFPSWEEIKPTTPVLQPTHFQLQRKPLYLVIYSTLLDSWEE